jgi:predicted TIM-barrel fold metal-dependent hydrolase
MTGVRRDFEMTEEDLKHIISASQPVPYLIFGGREPRSQQENANAAWESLGRRMGFVSMSVRPNGKGQRCFSAIPREEE